MTKMEKKSKEDLAEAIKKMEKELMEKMADDVIVNNVFACYKQSFPEFDINEPDRAFFVMLAHTALNALHLTQEGFRLQMENLERPILYTSDNTPNLLNKVLP